jgi:hypothetical protein
MPGLCFPNTLGVPLTDMGSLSRGRNQKPKAVHESIREKACIFSLGKC